MSRRRPSLDLTPPDLSRQVAEFCVEFPQFDYESLLYICSQVAEALERVVIRERPQKA